MKRKYSSYLSHATHAVRQGNPKTAVELAGKFIDDALVEEREEYATRLITISSRLSTYQKNHNLGLMSYENDTLESNKIAHSLVELINELQEFAPQQRSSKGLFDVESVPRVAVSDTIYHGFLLFGGVVGLSFALCCLILIHELVIAPVNTIEEFLFAGAIGFYGSSHLTGAFDGLNRNSGLLVNWKLIGPQIIIGTLLLISSALLSFLNN